MADEFKAFVKGASDFVKSLDTGGFSQSPPMTRTASSHGVTIKTNKGVKIGRIQSWAHNMARTVDAEFEIHANNRGLPVERVPQAQMTNSISVERYELYNFRMGEAFGTPVLGSGVDLINLTDQTKPFHVREIWRDPFGDFRVYGYLGCWFSNLGVTLSANDDRIIRANATLEYTRKIRVN